MKKYARDKVQKYLVICSALGIVLIMLWLIICFTAQNHMGIFVALMIVLFLNRVATRIIANKLLLSVLCKNLDANEFQEIINDNRLIAPIIYRASASMASGDYQTAINIATKQLNNQKNHIRLKHYYLSILARVYFELRDFEKLKVLLAKYEELKGLYPKKSFLSTPNSAWSYYRHFLNHNYEACKNVCNERNLGHNPKAWDAKFSKLQNDFLYAVACYENEEINEAKESFENIISYAP